MKELSIEEKAKAYDEAIERAKVFKEHLLEIDEKDYADEMDYVFPALKESEDEKIRQELISLFRDCINERNHPYNSSDSERWLAWLEKQGENNMGISEDTKQKLEDNLNKALEKETPESCNEFLEKQGEQEKLNAYIDKLASDTIYNDENGNPIDKDLIAFASKVAFLMIPATKTESYHHLNRVRISDVVIKGAQWKKQSEQKPAWSEEDEKILRTIISDGIRGAELDMLQIDWLKSLKNRVQPKQEWSDEDYNEIETIACHLDNIGNEAMAESLLNIIDKYKSCRPQSHWKPSDEQMEAMQKALVDLCGKDEHNIITGLYYNLRKLKG